MLLIIIPSSTIIVTSHPLTRLPIILTPPFTIIHTLLLDILYVAIE